MNEETYVALKRIMKHTTEGGPNDKQFWNDVLLIESWIDEVAKEYTLCNCGRNVGFHETQENCK